MHKQVNQSRIVDNMNRMSQPVKGKTFLGFKRVYWGNRWGFSVDGHNFSAVYSWDKQSKTVVTDDKKEEAQLESKSFYPLLLQGVGDLSFVKRFESKEAADEWFYAENIINSEVDKSLLKVDKSVPSLAPKTVPKLHPKKMEKEVKVAPVIPEKSVSQRPLSKMLKMGSKEK
jgi:hypothetical protein